MHAIGHAHGVGGPAHVVQPHGELVSAVAGEGVALAQARLQPAGDLLQQLVARLVAEGVVHHLEVVDVDEEHGEAVVLVPARPVERVAEQVEEERAVGQAGQRVVARVVRHPLHHRAVPGDVAHQSRDAQGGSGRVSLRGAAGVQPAPFAAAVAHPVLVVEGGGAAFQVGGDGRAQRRRVLRVHPLQPVGGRAQERGLQREQVAPGRREVELVLAQVPVPDHVEAGFHRERKPLLALAELDVLLHRLGLVADHRGDPRHRPVALLPRRSTKSQARARPPFAEQARVRATGSPRSSLRFQSAASLSFSIGWSRSKSGFPTSAEASTPDSFAAAELALRTISSGVRSITAIGLFSSSRSRRRRARAARACPSALRCRRNTAFCRPR